MPIAKQTAIVKALAKFNQTVLWKWESDSIVEKPENVYIEKWLPQRDVLCMRVFSMRIIRIFFEFSNSVRI